MKAIIQRALPLDVKYFLIGKKYVPIEQSGGAYICDNCGKIIANIATVKDEAGKVSDIGFDCLESILINNSLLSTGDIAAYEKAKKMIPKILRFAKTVKENLDKHSSISGLRFEAQTFASDYHTFYWLQSGNTTSRDNDYMKMKDADIHFVIETLKNIFPNLTFIYE